jgi:hypothetical protein
MAHEREQARMHGRTHTHGQKRHANKPHHPTTKECGPHHGRQGSGWELHAIESATQGWVECRSRGTIWRKEIVLGGGPN